MKRGAISLLFVLMLGLLWSGNFGEQSTSNKGIDENGQLQVLRRVAYTQHLVDEFKQKEKKAEFQKQVQEAYDDNLKIADRVSNSQKKKLDALNQTLVVMDNNPRNAQRLLDLYKAEEGLNTIQDELILDYDRLINNY